ncbi:MAG: LysE family translocator [Proteobacteria bacterium]|nr:LysE family translocator [Pseudomonadota bacterium]
MLEFSSLFVLTVFVATIIPGPGMLLCLVHGVRHGVRLSLATILGLTSVSVGQAAISLAGLGALLAASEQLFMLVRWAGAVYLIYLGIGMLVGSGKPMTPAGDGCCPQQAVTWRKLFTEGACLAAANPKAIVFFGALFPQFIPVGGAGPAQVVFMLTVVAIVSIVGSLIYAYAGGVLINVFQSSRAVRWFERCVGGTFVASGLALAVSDR